MKSLQSPKLFIRPHCQRGPEESRSGPDTRTGGIDYDDRGRYWGGLTTARSLHWGGLMLGVRNGPAAVAPKNLDQLPSPKGRELAQEGHWDRASLAAGGVVLVHNGRRGEHLQAHHAPGLLHKQ